VKYIWYFGSDLSIKIVDVIIGRNVDAPLINDRTLVKRVGYEVEGDSHLFLPIDHCPVHHMSAPVVWQTAGMEIECEIID